MMRRNKSGANEQKGSQPFTYIHQGTTLNGDLKAEGRVRVHGMIRGDVEVNGILEVAESGVIEGDKVVADEIKIIGSVRANVEATGKIEIWKTGKLEGDVQARALDIEEGATFVGRSEMSPASAPVATLTERASSVSEKKTPVMAAAVEQGE